VEYESGRSYIASFAHHEHLTRLTSTAIRRYHHQRQIRHLCASCFLLLSRVDATLYARFSCAMSSCEKLEIQVSVYLQPRQNIQVTTSGIFTHEMQIMEHGRNHCCGEGIAYTNTDIAARLMEAQASRQATALRSLGLSEPRMLQSGVLSESLHGAAYTSCH